MKKFVGIIVATVLAFSLVGCGPVDGFVGGQLIRGGRVRCSG